MTQVNALSANSEERAVVPRPEAEGSIDQLLLEAQYVSYFDSYVAMREDVSLYAPKFIDVVENGRPRRKSVVMNNEEIAEAHMDDIRRYVTCSFKDGVLKLNPSMIAGLSEISIDSIVEAYLAQGIDAAMVRKHGQVPASVEHTAEDAALEQQTLEAMEQSLVSVESHETSRHFTDRMKGLGARLLSVFSGEITIPETQLAKR